MLVARLVAEVGLDDGVDVADVMFFIGGVVSVLTLWALLRGMPLWKRVCDLFQWFERLREDWDGEPARDGRDRIPGIPERMNAIDGEFKRNGGSTLKDAVFETQRIVQGLEVETKRVADELKTTSATISARLDASEEVRHAILEATNVNMEATRQAFLTAGLEPPAYTTIPIPKHSKEST